MDLPERIPENPELSADFLKEIVLKGNLIDKDYFYFSHQTKDFDKVIKLKYRFDNNVYSVIQKKDRSTYYNAASAVEQLNILQKMSLLGVNLPISFANDDDLFMFDLEKQYPNSLLIDFGRGGNESRRNKLNLDYRPCKINFIQDINEPSIRFDSIENYEFLSQAIPFLFARFKKYFYVKEGGFSDPFFLLLKKEHNTFSGQIYAIDVEYVSEIDNVLNFSSSNFPQISAKSDLKSLVDLETDLVHMFDIATISKMKKTFHKEYVSLPDTLEQYKSNLV